MMFKVLFKDQYTSGYAKKIAGSYTLVAGFLIRQYSFQHTCCILKELWGILMLCGRHVYSRCRISYSLLHKSVYMMYTAWSRKGTDSRRCVLWGFNELFLTILMGKFTIVEYSYGVRSALKIFALLRCDQGGIIKSWIISCFNYK